MLPNLSKEDSIQRNISTTILQMSPRVQVQVIWPVHDIYRCDYDMRHLHTTISSYINNFYLTCLIHGYKSLLYTARTHLIVLSPTWMIHNVCSISPGCYTTKTQFHLVITRQKLSLHWNYVSRHVLSAPKKLVYISNSHLYLPVSHCP